MQLSVPRYKAIAVDRGANLDTLDVPLNNRLWLEQTVRASCGQLPTKPSAGGHRRDRAIGPIPGPAASTTIWANPTRQPHLVRGLRAPERSGVPGVFAGGIRGRRGLRGPGGRTPKRCYDAPLRMHYEGLDPAAHYTDPRGLRG